MAVDTSTFIVNVVYAARGILIRMRDGPIPRLYNLVVLGPVWKFVPFEQLAAFGCVIPCDSAFGFIEVWLY